MPHRPDGASGCPAHAIADLTLGTVPGWGPPAVLEMLDVIQSTAAPFPCTFAVSAARKRSLRFAFCDGFDEDALAPLPGLLTAYLDGHRDLGRDTSFVVLFPDEPEDRALGGYRELFWAILDRLHAADDRPWPADVPLDPDDPRWEFCFHGEPIFVVCNTPAHEARRSRHSPGFVVTFQPRWVFEGIEAHTRQGQAARKVIRRRLAAYDAVAPSPALGDYGAPGNREWKQYFLDDGDGGDDRTDGDGVCPFGTARARGRSS